jgi:hypothetical protein
MVGQIHRLVILIHHLPVITDRGSHHVHPYIGSDFPLHGNKPLCAAGSSDTENV